jgi:DNA mismatch repair protein MutH
LERQEAIIQLEKLVGLDLRALAEKLDVKLSGDGRRNKGWAGHVIERYLGLPINSSQSPNFGSWELKVVPLRDRGGTLFIKETMAITMIDPYEVSRKPFLESHLYSKLRKIVICSRIFESVDEVRSVLYSVSEFDLGNQDVFRQVEQDYEEVRSVILSKGFGALSGSMGKLVQPRTKGPGHGSTTRAFYARTTFVRDILTLSQPSSSWVRSDAGSWSLLPAPDEPMSVRQV